MQINIAEPEKHEVHDYDISLDNGVQLQLTVDETLGDSINIGPETTQVHLAKKPSRMNPKVILAAEDILVFNSHVMVVSHKIRLAAVSSEADETAWMETLKATTTLQ